MSIATDIRRIATAKQEIKEVVNQDFNKITNETIDQYANKLQETYDEYESYIPWEHAKGSQIEFTKGGNGSYLEECIVEGNTEQNLYSGKNLCNYLTSLDRPSYNGITCTVADDIITFNGTATADNTTFSFIAPIEMKQSTTKVIAYYLSGSATTYCTLRTFDSNWSKNTSLNLLSLSRSNNKMQATSQYDYTATSVSIRFNEGSKASNLRIKIMVTDDTNTDFEPYCGKAPSPNPDYPQEVKVVNGTQNINIAKKNLFDKNNQNFKQYYILDNDGEEITSNASQYSLVFTKVKPNTVYTIQGELCSSQNVTRIYEYDINKKWIKKSSGIGINFIPYTFTTSSDTYFLRFQVEMAAYNGDTVQLEEGSTATTYEPYQGQTYPIALHGKNLFDGEYEIGAYNTGTGIKEPNSYMYRSTHSISVKPNTQYQFSIDGTTIPEAPRYFFYDINKNKLSSTVTSGSFTTPDNCYYLTWHSSALKTDYPNGLSKTQIEEGGAATAYEPYYDYELCKVRDYKDEIKKSTGKNLFDIDTSINDYFATISNGEKINTRVNISDYVSAEFTTNEIKILSYNNNGYRWLSKIINLKKNTDYTISASKLHSVKVVGFNSLEDGTDGTRLVFINNQTLTPPKTFNSGEYNYYVVTMYPQEAGNVYTNIQIEEGSTATDYEPYGEQWYIKKEIGKVVLDGSESWVLAQTNTDTLRFNCSNGLTNGLDINTLKIISNNFVNGISTSDNSDNEHIRSAVLSYPTMVSICINKTRLSSQNIEGFKTWLSSHNTTVYYILATPTYEKITNETLINQLEAIKELKTYENKTSIMAIGADTNPVLDWTLSSGPAFQKWLNNPTINEEEEI